MTDMTGYDDMTCDAFASQLADHLEGDAPAAVRAAVEAHAARCAECGALLSDLLAISRDAAALPVLAPSRDLWAGISGRIDARVLPLGAPAAGSAVRRTGRRWLRPGLAAAALVLVTAGVTHVLTRASLGGEGDTVVAAAPRDTAGVKQAGVDSAVPRQLALRQDPSDLASQRGEGSSGPTPSVRSRRERGGAVKRAARPDTSTVPRAWREAAARATPARLANSAAPVTDPAYDRDIGTLRKIVRERRDQLDPATVAVLEQSVAVIDSAIAQSRAALAKDPASRFLATQLNQSLEKKIELLRTVATLPARS